MVTLRAYFDGRVLVPEGPVDLPQGTVLEVRVQEVGADVVRPEQAPFYDVVDGFPVIRVPPDAKPITMEDVKQAEDDK